MFNLTYNQTKLTSLNIVSSFSHSHVIFIIVGESEWLAFCDGKFLSIFDIKSLVEILRIPSTYFPSNIYHLIPDSRHFGNSSHLIIFLFLTTLFFTC